MAIALSTTTTSRYELLAKVAAGGMATVYVGRSRVRGGVTRLFAVKRAHPHLLDDVTFRKMFVAEARLASRIHHPNVVAVQDVEELDEELLLVMDYVEGIALTDLRGSPNGGQLSAKTRIRVATRIVLDACAGLHAAHDLRSDDGRRLDIVHRDVSPHNVLVGVDGIGRLTDFGIAKSSFHTGGMTATGGLKGKLGYMAPEYIESSKADQRADIFGLGAVLWEAITGKRLFQAITELELMKVVIECKVPPPSSLVPEIPKAFDAVVLKALTRSPNQRFATALAFAEALEDVARATNLLATHREVGKVVEELAHDVLAQRRAILRQSMSDGAASSTGDGSTDEFARYEGHEHTATLEPNTSSAGSSPNHDQDGDGEDLAITPVAPQQIEDITLHTAADLSRPAAAHAQVVVYPHETGSHVYADAPTLMQQTPLITYPATTPPPGGKKKTPSSSMMGTLITIMLGAMTIVLVWVAAKRFMPSQQEQQQPQPALEATTPTPLPIQTNQTAVQAPVPTPATAPTPTPTVVMTNEPATAPSTRPAASHRRPSSLPATRPVASPTSLPDEPPSHAPPSPYKDASVR